MSNVRCEWIKSGNRAKRLGVVSDVQLATCVDKMILGSGKRARSKVATKTIYAWKLVHEQETEESLDVRSLRILDWQVEKSVSEDTRWDDHLYTVSESLAKCKKCN